MRIQRGILTSSDHYPVVITVATKPIIKEVKPSLIFRKADWNKFKENVNQEIMKTNNDINLDENRTNRIDKEKIDRAIEGWMNAVTNSVKRSIPERKIVYYPRPKESDFLRLLERMYIDLRNN